MTTIVNRNFLLQSLAFAVVFALVSVTALWAQVSGNDLSGSRSNYRQEETENPVTAPIELKASTLRLLDTVRIKVPLDIVLVQDETGSFGDDIATLKSLSPQIWDSIALIAAGGFRMSVVGFRDYARGSWGNSGDWVYRLVTDFTTSRDEFIAAVNTLTAGGGNDTPEAQYAALHYLLIPAHPCVDANGNGTCTDTNDTPAGQQPLFRSGAQRVILFTTDAYFHSPSNTSGYPGPSRDTVVNDLLSTRTILIGLVPGGPGAISEVDDLAAITGGSVQATGASGQQVADAIIAALSDIKPVSPDLSTISVSPASVASGGSTTVTVTLLDTDGKPVPGKSVSVYTNRGVTDAVTQPCCRTDMSGRTTASVRSSVPGSAAIRAVDVTDNVTLASSASVEFTGEVMPGAALTDAINRLHGGSDDALNILVEAAPYIAEKGTFFGKEIGPDSVSLVLNAIVNGVSLGIAASPPKIGKQVGQFTISGLVESKAEEAIKKGEKGLFNIARRLGLVGKDYSKITHAIVDGLNQFASEATGDSIETVVIDGWSTILGPTLLGACSLEPLANIFVANVPKWQQYLAEEQAGILSSVPPISDLEQSQYAADLNLRAPVPQVLSDSTIQQDRLLSTLEDAKASANFVAWVFLLAKVGAGMGMTAAFGPAGQLATVAAGAIVDTWIDAKTLKDDSWGYEIGFGAMSNLINFQRTIAANELSAYSRILNSLPPQTDAGQLLKINHMSRGWYIIPFPEMWWSEKSSYTDILIRNTSRTTNSYSITANYGGDAWLYGIEKRYLPLLAQGAAVEVAPGQVAPIRVYYKDLKENGLSPKEGSDIRLDVLAINESGTFLVTSQVTPWKPERLDLLASAAASSTQERSHLMSTKAVTDTPVTIDNPIFTQVNQASDSVYEGRIFVSNPFPGPIDADVEQPVPAGIVVLNTDGTNSGSKVVWTKHVEASDVAVVTFRFSREPGGPPSLPPASVSFTEPSSGSKVSASSSAPQLQATLPLGIAAMSSGVDFSQDKPATAALNGSIAQSMLPDVFDPNGAVVTIYVGGVSSVFTLDKAGKASNGSGTFSLTFQNSAANSSWNWKANLRLDAKAQWAAYGLTDENVIGRLVHLPVSLTINNGEARTFSSEVALQYTASKGKKGVAVAVYSLAVGSAGSGAGTIMSSPKGISCGSQCSHFFKAGSKVTLTARADAKSRFSGWSGSCAGKGACSVLVDSDKTVAGLFISEPDIAVTPKLKEFGKVKMGKTVSASFKVSNKGTLPLNIAAVKIEGSDASDFSLKTDSCSGNLVKAGASCVAAVSFTPGSGGVKSATLSVSSDDPDTQVVTISLSGTGSP